MAVRVSHDLDLFNLLVQEPRTVADMAKLTGAEHQLVLRLARTLCSLGLITQLGTEKYGASAVTKQLTRPSVKAGMIILYDGAFDTLHKTPEWFQKNGYIIPKSTTDTPYQYTHNTDLAYYPHLLTIPGRIEVFNTYMQGLFGTPKRLPWSKWFPVKDIIVDGYKSENSEYLFVDMGGGRGHECEAVLEECPDAKGRIVLQELQHVIDDAKDLNPRVDKQVHDFMTPQPVVGEYNGHSHPITSN